MILRFRFFYPLLLIALVTACAGNGHEAAPTERGAGGFSQRAGMVDEARDSKSLAPVLAEVREPSGEIPQNLQEVSPKIIRQGEVAFEVRDLKQTRVFLDSLVRRYDAYLANDDQYKYEDRIEQRLVIRIPADNFEPLINGLEDTVERFDRKTISARDVTEEFLDVSLRLRIKKETEQRYRDILVKANTVKEILEVERYIGRIRAEIESLEGRLKYLENRISFSTLTVTFYQLKPEAVGFSSQFLVALKNGWNNFMLFVLGIVSLWPFILAGLILLLILFILAGRRSMRE